jgi:hypothetical protein
VRYFVRILLFASVTPSVYGALSDDLYNKAPWIQKAAIGSNEQAINWLANGYKFGWFGFKVDLARAKCLRAAAAEGKSASHCLT